MEEINEIISDNSIRIMGITETWYTVVLVMQKSSLTALKSIVKTQLMDVAVEY